ncbi:unnamed protein product, partial [Ixodes persulcatus]
IRASFRVFLVSTSESTTKKWWHLSHFTNLQRGDSQTKVSTCVHGFPHLGQHRCPSLLPPLPPAELAPLPLSTLPPPPALPRSPVSPSPLPPTAVRSVATRRNR